MFTREFARTTVIAGAVLLAASLSACSDDSPDADARWRFRRRWRWIRWRRERERGGDGDDGGGGPVDDRCSVEALQPAFGGEVAQVGSVAYCDGDWAVSGNSPA